MEEEQSFKFLLLGLLVPIILAAIIFSLYIIK